MTLYLKYRSQTLDELDQEAVRESLKKIVAKGNIPHALLFSGPKGTGKTSAARILAKVVNCEKPKKGGEPCNSCDQCISITKGDNIDVIELDAASHRGIDDVRALRDAVKLAPARAKKKVYIIDEAHMLTTEASNALLKTLEEPPEHVMFILATTNPEKLIETIRSRCTNVLFKKADTQEILRSLERVTGGEKIKADKKALEMIAKSAEGSFRDAQKILEQLLMEEKKITAEEVEDYLYNKKSFAVEGFLELLAQKKVKNALVEIEKAVGMGTSVKSMVFMTIARLREGLMAEVGLNGNELKGFTKDELIDLIKLMAAVVPQISSAVLEQIPFEIAVVEWCQVETESTLKDSGGGEAEETKKLQTQKAQKKPESSVQTDYESDEGSEPSTINNGSHAESLANGSLNDNVWARVLTEIRPRNASTEALLRASKPIDFDGKVLTLGVYYKFHKEHLEANPHRDILEAVIGEIFGQKIRVKCSLAEPPIKNAVEKTSSDSNGEENTEEEVVLTESKDEDIIKVAKEIFGS